MSVPHFDGIELGDAVPPADSGQQWEDLIDQVPSYSKGWQTPEHILVPPVYGADALGGLDFLNTYRLEMSLRLLKETERPISDVSLSCGFTSQSYFTKLFTERYHMTPSGCRKK